VLLIGCGALGTHLAEFCVRAGVGALTIVDRDFVELSNLQRQSLFTEADALEGVPKAIAAARALSAIDSTVRVSPIIADFTHDNAEDLATQAFRDESPSSDSSRDQHTPRIILDATDNFETRFLINDLACEINIPWVYAGCVGSRAVCMPIVPNETACLACILEAMPPASGESCETTGIIMPAVLAAVSMASAEALKLMLAPRGQAHSATIVRMRTHDVWTGESSSLSASHPRRDCPVCALGQRPHLSGRAGDAAIRLCGRNAVQLRPAVRLTPGGFAELSRRLGASSWPVLARNEFLIRVAGGGGGGLASGQGQQSLELTIFADGRILVTGTDDFAVARSFAARVVG